MEEEYETEYEEDEAPNKWIGYVLSIVLMISIFACGIGIGWAGNKLYDAYSNKRVLNGLWINYNITNLDAVKEAEKYDEYGTWVCVNIKQMKYQDIIDTCIHEASHELFARNCETNATKCMELENGS